MIVVTGGAGFIGSAFVWYLNSLGIDDILIVDELGKGKKWLNLRKLRFVDVVAIDDFDRWLAETPAKIDGIVHMGACSATTEEDADFLMRNNVHYSMRLFDYCVKNKVPYVYASSAATYGGGECGYSDSPATSLQLLPINKYGYSKQLFDRWVLNQSKRPPAWAGLKFFNVYGPQEYHKGGQASVVFHAYPQVRDERRLKLFKSYRQDIEHGEQQRDFVYIKDVVKVIYHCLIKLNTQSSGIYNVGSGEARSFADLGRAVFTAMNQEPSLDWIEMPQALRNQYQYFTEADLTRLRSTCGYTDKFCSLEEGVKDYVQNYLDRDDAYL